MHTHAHHVTLWKNTQDTTGMAVMGTHLPARLEGGLG